MLPLQFCGVGRRVDQHQTWTIQASFGRSSCQAFEVCPVRRPVYMQLRHRRIAVSYPWPVPKYNNRRRDSYTRASLARLLLQQKKLPPNACKAGTREAFGLRLRFRDIWGLHFPPYPASRFTRFRANPEPNKALRPQICGSIFCRSLCRIGPNTLNPRKTRSLFNFRKQNFEAPIEKSKGLTAKSCAAHANLTGFLYGSCNRHYRIGAINIRIGFGVFESISKVLLLTLFL